MKIYTGAVAGSLHGVLTVGVDSAIARQLVPHIPGTVLSHTLVHASLFGTYEFTKVRTVAAVNSLYHYRSSAASTTTEVVFIKYAPISHAARQ
jgi:hypothetical protein